MVDSQSKLDPVSGHCSEPCRSEPCRSEPSSRPRLVLLGASNLAAGLEGVVRGARGRLGEPVEVLAACGHGRSYGRGSGWLLVRRLPGVLGCGLWSALEAEPEAGGRVLRAVVADVGNDLVYGVEPERLLAWVGECVERLEAVAVGAGSRLSAVVVAPPVAGLEAADPRLLGLARRLFFPGVAAVPVRRLVARARRVAEGLGELEARPGVVVMEPERSSYGFDPIHPRRGCRGLFWGRVLEGLEWPRVEEDGLEGGGLEGGGLEDGGSNDGGMVLERRRGLPGLRAAEVELGLGAWSRRWVTAQPSWVWSDGTTISQW